MRRKVESLAEDITRVVSAWESVECVTLGQHSETDTLDPYFALVIDVYFRGDVPSAERRCESLAAVIGDPGAFESAGVRRPKDRFLIDGLPIRVEYKSVERIDAVANGGSGPARAQALEGHGTYPLFRLLSSRVMFRRSDWIDRVRDGLSSMPDDFWNELEGALAAKMEHLLGDMGAAAMRDDAYFYIVSSAGFAKYATAVLFVLNKRFEPSARAMDEQLHALPILPADFRGRWESFLRSDVGMNRDKKFEIAQLIARSIIALH
ncbi:MAG: DUF4037 domain-containing protein [Spirochaetaceae bacterium]|nr:DUF4037 domain-containing protein [Spirochaetaceae bacterium]